MRIGSAGGDALELSVTGYQFPLAPDPRLRHSWHMVWGRAVTSREVWQFHWQALTCDESVSLISWLERAADAIGAAGSSCLELLKPPRASFTEPNLTFDLGDVGIAGADLRVELDLEFRAPSNRRGRGAGSPSVLVLKTSAAQLREASSAWAEDVDHFPDLLADPLDQSTRDDPT